MKWLNIALTVSNCNVFTPMSGTSRPKANPLASLKPMRSPV